MLIDKQQIDFIIKIVYNIKMSTVKFKERQVVFMKKEKTKKKPILSFGSMLMYSLGILGIQTFIGYINSYQSQFYTSILGAKLTVCAIIILVSKIISSLADPIIGNIIDSSHFKSGKMKPFVLMSSIPLAVLTTIMFVNINLGSDILMFTYITITTVLWNIAMSFADIPSQGMLALLSPEAEEKNSCAGISNLAKSAGLAVPNVLIPAVCIMTGSDVIGAKEYLYTALVICALGAVLYVLMLAGTKEVVRSEPNKMSFKEMFTELKDNKMLMIVFLMFMLGFGRNIGMSIGVQAAAVLCDATTINIGSFSFTLAGENLPLLIGIPSGVAAAISLVLAPIVNKKLGEKKTYIAFAVYGFITATASFLLFTFGGESLRSLVAILIYQFVIGFMFGTHTYSPLVMLSDIVDYREMKTGKRTEGTQYAILSLSVKLSNAFSVACGIFLVGLSGYTGSMTYADVTPHMQNVVMAAYWLIPGVSTMLSAIPVFFYVIDDKVKAQIREYKEKNYEKIS